MGKIKRSFTMGGGKATLACLILIFIALAFTGCEQPNNTVNDYIITDDGTWEIYTADGLLAWNEHVMEKSGTGEGPVYENLDTNATLMADISLAGISWTPVGYYDYDTYKPYRYAGKFNGNGHTISNLSITSSYNGDLGLFGDIEDIGEVKNLILKDVYISVNDAYSVGGIAGYNYGTIENCNVSGTVSGGYDVGGIAGYNLGTIENCSVSGIVSGSADSVGGIAGENWEGTIKNCSVSGNVSGSLYSVGGIAGKNLEGTITACYHTGVVSGSYDVGGIAGRNVDYSTIIACYNTGEVSVTGSSTNVGGVVGYNYNSTVNTCFWESSTSLGIGSGSQSETVKKVDGNDVTWETAMKEMNNELSESGYTYEANTNEETNTIMPLVIKKSSN